MPTKPTTPKEPKAPRKPRAKSAEGEVKPKAAVHKKPAKVEADAPAVAEEVHTAHAPKAHAPKGRYIFATGRRKTAVSNVRMFEGQGDIVINKKPFKQYFAFSFYQDEILKPFEVTGLGDKYYFTAHVNGGGPHSQAQSMRHGIAVALSKISEDVRKVLKKNGFLTRDDRKKERKKPGLKRARRSPQWAKR